MVPCIVVIVLVVYITLLLIGRVISLNRFRSDGDSEDEGLTWIEERSLHNLIRNPKFKTAMENGNFETVRAMLEEIFPNEAWPWQQDDSSEDDRFSIKERIEDLITDMEDNLEILYLRSMKCYYRISIKILTIIESLIQR